MFYRRNPDEQQYVPQKPQNPEGSCAYCGGYLVLTDDYYQTCTECGICIDDRIQTDKIFNKSHTHNICTHNHPTTIYKGYQRMKYFLKKFRFLEANQKRKIPTKILDLIPKDLIKKSKNFNEAKQHIQQILKKNGLATQYYKHIPLIYYYITKRKPFKFHPQFKIDAYRIYEKMQQNFLHNSTNKKKFVPWEYAMKQICILLKNETNVYNSQDYLEIFKDFKLEKNTQRNFEIWSKTYEEIYPFKI